jgi:hypothetical protein
MAPTDKDEKTNGSDENDAAEDEQAAAPPPIEAASTVDESSEAPWDAHEAAEPPEDESDSTEDVPPSRLYRFARKLMDRRELAEDTRELMVAFLSTSDRAKTEMVKMAAREVRTYLEELKLKDDMLNLVRNHSLEVKASFSLKPIEAALEPESNDNGEG